MEVALGVAGESRALYSARLSKPRPAEDRGHVDRGEIALLLPVLKRPRIGSSSLRVPLGLNSIRMTRRTLRSVA
jgi:hypothetical protein